VEYTERLMWRQPPRLSAERSEARISAGLRCDLEHRPISKRPTEGATLICRAVDIAGGIHSHARLGITAVDAVQLAAEVVESLLGPTAAHGRNQLKHRAVGIKATRERRA